MASRVLIADDDADIARAIQINLELDGYHVSLAREGFEVLDVARRVRPDVILLDVVMPGIDGFEVCRELHDDPITERCAVIFLTAKGSSHDEALGRAAGAVDYIVKPFNPADLLARVRAAVAGAHVEE